VSAPWSIDAESEESADAGASPFAGLIDRIAALGGTLSVVTPTIGRPRVVAEIRLGI
jgi:hypothetical protein